MNKKEAYEIVYKDLMNGAPMLRGRYDAVHGNPHFMNGIFTVMMCVATMAGNEAEDEFEETWYENIKISKEKAKRCEEEY